MNSYAYVVASSKDWHRPAFEALQQESHGRWGWASTPAELERVVAEISPRYVFFLHWNWHVPRSIWSALECVCFHMTDVPYGRGGSPLQNLIAGGHTATMLSALRMVEEMDAGPVYAKRPLSLDGSAEEIYRRAGELSVEIIRWIVGSQPEPVAQTGEPTVFRRRTPEQSRLPDEGSLQALYDHIRMLDAPTYPFAFVEHGDFRIELRDARLEGDELHARVVICRNRQDIQKD